MHTRHRQTDRQTDGRTNIMAIVPKLRLNSGQLASFIVYNHIHCVPQKCCVFWSVNSKKVIDNDVRPFGALS